MRIKRKKSIRGSAASHRKPYTGNANEERNGEKREEKAGAGSSRPLRRRRGEARREHGGGNSNAASRSPAGGGARVMAFDRAPARRSVPGERAHAKSALGSLSLSGRGAAESAGSRDPGSPRRRASAPLLSARGKAPC